jgi:hypothetical protein
MTTTATPSTPLLGGLAVLLAKARRPRPALFAATGVEDRDRQRVLSDLRALPDARADVACRVRVQQGR